MKNTKLITMIEGAIIAGVCVALSYIPLNTANASFDISLGLIPLGVYALRRGLLPGMAVGFVWGILLIVLGKAYFLAGAEWYMTLVQVVLEYPIAFAFGGFGGIMAPLLHRELKAERVPAAFKTVIFAGIFAAGTRWIFHFLAGFIFWGSYAPEGMSPVVFSLVFNGASAIVNAAILAAALAVILRAARSFFMLRENEE